MRSFRLIRTYRAFRALKFLLFCFTFLDKKYICKCKILCHIHIILNRFLYIFFIWNIKLLKRALHVCYIEIIITFGLLTNLRADYSNYAEQREQQVYSRISLQLHVSRKRHYEHEHRLNILQHNRRAAFTRRIYNTPIIIMQNYYL